MNLSDQDMVALYNDGLNIQQIAKIAGRGRETVRVILKRHGTKMRFRGVKYDPISVYSHERKQQLAELFGYLMGDGSISKRKNGSYDCILALALKEKNFVNSVINITKQLFGYVPKIRAELDYGCYKIVFRRSIARYLCEQCGYPAGKKSVVNPRIPSWIMQSTYKIKAAFIRGFLNAEASVDDCVKVAQSVRISLPEDLRDQLRRIASINNEASYRYYSSRWEKAKPFVVKYTKPSNVLLDLQKLLSEFQIGAKIYLNRVWMSSKSDGVSIHYELYIQKKMLNRLKQFNMLTKGR